VHGAGVFDGGGRGVGIGARSFGSELGWFVGRLRRCRGLGGQVFLGGGAEFFGAAGGAEVVGFAGVFDRGFGALEVNGHAADGIAFGGLRAGHFREPF